MAKQVDYQKKRGFETGFGHDNVLRTKAQQYYSAANSGYRYGPKQDLSRRQVGNVEGKKNWDIDRREDNGKQIEISGFRKRSGNSKNVDVIRAEAVIKDRQLYKTGGARNNRFGMSTEWDDAQNEKAILNKDSGEFSRNERQNLGQERQSFDDEKANGNQKSSLAAQKEFNNEADVRKPTELIIKTNLEFPSQNKSRNSASVVNFETSGGNFNQNNGRKNDEGRILSRSGSLDRRKVQVKQGDLSLRTQAKTCFDRQIVDAKSEAKSNLERSKFAEAVEKQQRNESGEEQQTDAKYRGVNKIDVPRLNIGSNEPNHDDKTQRNSRYDKSFGMTEIKHLNSDTQIPRFERRIGDNSGFLRRSFKEGDKDFKRPSLVEKNLPERVVTIRKSSEFQHIRQASDPTSQFPAARKLSSMSKDLMRSKEELINRSKECGRMLEEYRQREEERREQLARNEKRSELPPKTAERKWAQTSSENDESTGNAASQERRLQQDRSVDEDQGKQSPRYGKRKGSYIDSWVQSQHNRISNLVSAIKEEDSDDNCRADENSSRQRTKSMPPDSVAFLSWGRSDESGQDIDDKPTGNIVHTRSHSGEEIMGIAKAKELPRFTSKFADGPQRQTVKSKVISPRDNGSGYNPENIRARSLYLQQETYTRGKVNNSAVKSPLSPNSSMELESGGENRFRPVTSPRSQSERTSPQLQKSFESAKSISVGNSPRLRKETTFDSGITTKVVSASEASPISPRPVVSRCSSSASDYVNKEQQQRRTSLEQQQQQQTVSPRNTLTRRSSSSSDYVTRNNQQRIVSPGNSLPRRSSSSDDNALKHRRTSSSGTPTERSLVTSERSLVTNEKSPDYKWTGSPQGQQSTPNRSGTEEQFDWPAPPDLEAFAIEDDPQNQSWPSSSSSPFMNRRSHMEGSRHFPVAVVKPLQHEKTQSWDGTFPRNDAFEQKFDNRSQLKERGAILNKPAARSETVTCYNVRAVEETREMPRDHASNSSVLRDNSSNSSMPRDHSSNSSLLRDNSSNSSLLRDRSSNSSQEIIHEKPVDVGNGNVHSSEDFSNSEQGMANLITQEFQWYKPASRTASNAASLERGATRESIRDSTEERLGRFKRGSKLLSSKYQSFSKSLENLSKVGKDLIKGKKKTGKEEKKEEKSKKNRPERKSVVLGDLELNDEFAMKMERRSRLSLEMANQDNDDMRRRSDQFETRQSSDVGKRLASPETKQTGAKKKETLIDFPMVSNESLGPEKNSVIPKDSIANSERKRKSGSEIRDSYYPEYGYEKMSDRYDRPEPGMASGFEARGARNDVVKRREVKSAYFEESEAKHVTPRPKSEFYKCNDGDDYDYDHRKNVAFEDYDEPNDEEEKEMVKIVRKISGLRSSQMKIKPPVKYDRKENNRERAESDPTVQMSDDQRRLTNNDDDKLVHGSEALEGHVGESKESPDRIRKDDVTLKQSEEDVSRDTATEENAAKSSSDPDPMKRISTSLSRVMTDLRELREQDLTLATQLITLGKSIKHFKEQKKEMEDFYAIINEDTSTEEYDSTDDEEEHDAWAVSRSRITTDF